MRYLRAFVKLVLIALATLFCYLLILPGVILGLTGLNTNGWKTYFLSLWGKLTCAIIGLKVKVKGKAPKPPFFIVSNHLSYLDIMMLISELRCLFIAKSEVMSWPIFGFMTRTVGMLFVDRSKRTDVRRVNKLISKNINSKQGLLLFPEGTTSPGYEVMPFKASLLAYPAEQEMPVFYATITYSTPEGDIPAYESVCWWGDAGFISHFFNMLKLKKIYGTITFAEHPVIHSDRKQLAQLLFEGVASNFDPVIDYSDYAEKYLSS